MEQSIPVSQIEAGAAQPGVIEEMGWFFSGAVLPLASLSYYRKASRRRVAVALMFFAVFTCALTLLATLSLGVGMSKVTPDIQRAFEDGSFPVIVIENGMAQVDAPQPFILLDEQNPGSRSFAAIDTTGQILEIDRSTYDQGFLLTRTELHVLNNNGEYQVISLRDLNLMLEQDPLIVNAETVSRAWGLVSVIAVIAALVFLFLWHSIVRLMFLAMVALVLWGFISLLRPKTDFAPIISSGLYATVPAVYISHVFSRSGAGFPGLQTLLLIVFWSIGLAASLVENVYLSRERPMRLWTAWIGLPLILLLIIELFAPIPSPYGPVLLWTALILTGLGIAGVRLYFRWKEIPTPEVTA